MSTVPAVVVGLDLNGLGVVRSLGAARIPVIAIDTEPGKPTCTTRYASVRRAPALEGPPLVEALLRVREGLTENPVLLLTQEGSVATVSAERARLADAFRFSMPGHDLMRQLADKLGFQALAESLGFSLPRAIRLGHGTTTTLSDLRFPCVLKPVSKDPEYASRFRKAYRVSAADEALGLWEEMRTVAPEVIVQEWIEGGDGDVYFCLQYRPPHGGSVTSFVGRKLRQWPSLVGGTACCVPAPEHAADLLATTDRFFSAVGFVGPCSMEYKRDRRDGAFYMVEPTVGRTDFQEEVATLNGVNIPLAAYRGERGLSPPAPRSRRARGWRDPFGDANARAAGAPDEPSSVPLRDAYWRLADPLPFMSVHTRAGEAPPLRGLALRREGDASRLAAPPRAAACREDRIGRGSRRTARRRHGAAGGDHGRHGVALPRAGSVAHQGRRRGARLQPDRRLGRLVSGDHRLHHPDPDRRGAPRRTLRADGAGATDARLAGVHSAARRRLSGRPRGPDARGPGDLQHRPNPAGSGGRRRGVRRGGLRRCDARRRPVPARQPGRRRCVAALSDAVRQAGRQGVRDACLLGSVRGGPARPGRGLRRGGTAPGPLGADPPAAERMVRRQLPGKPGGAVDPHDRLRAARPHRGVSLSAESRPSGRRVADGRGAARPAWPGRAGSPGGSTGIGARRRITCV